MKIVFYALLALAGLVSFLIGLYMAAGLPYVLMAAGVPAVAFALISDYDGGKPRGKSAR